MARIEGWGRITKQPKSKKWVSAEYVTENQNPQRTILVYVKDKIWKGNKWWVYIGVTDGENPSDRHWSFETKKEAMSFAREYMRRHPDGVPNKIRFEFWKDEGTVKEVSIDAESYVVDKDVEPDDDTGEEIVRIWLDGA